MIPIRISKRLINTSTNAWRISFIVDGGDYYSALREALFRAEREI